MNVQYVSDIHTEFYKLKNVPEVKPIAECLALCGNIGYPFSDVYKKFIENCAKDFKYVFVIAGNHEYYQNPNKRRPMPEINKKIYEVCGLYKNVFYLQNDFVCISEDKTMLYYGDDVKAIPGDTKYIIIGTTLWSFIPQEAKYLITKLVSDYQNIYKDSDETYNYPTVTVNDINRLYLMNIEWLFKVLQIIDYVPCNPKVMVITHHAPSFDLLDKEKINPNIIHSYASEADSFFKKTIHFWLFGHAKQNIQKMIDKTLFASNCMGFPSGLLKDYTPSSVNMIG
jgi:hypothetical protein